VLEALYFCALGRSFRTYKDNELININNSDAKINVKYTKNNRDNEIEILISKNSKKNIKLNKIKLTKNSELVGNINIVIFSPDDIIILKQSPSLRRKFLDILISQLRPKYLHDLTEYNKILDQRNAELKNKKSDTIDVWNEQLAIYAEKIFISRKEYIQKLFDKIIKIQPQITNKKENIKIEYKTQFENKEQFINLLKNNHNLDMLRGYTSVGPHREDFEIYINDKELNIYGSQGQHRTALLALKIAELQIIEDETYDTPILLLDDVTSELDIERIKLIFDNIKKYQVFITCTDINSILRFDSLTKNIKLYNISEGKVI
jgi:DNA replication and repair protein RecF